MSSKKLLFKFSNLPYSKLLFVDYEFGLFTFGFVRWKGIFCSLVCLKSIVPYLFTWSLDSWWDPNKYILRSLADRFELMNCKNNYFNYFPHFSSSERFEPKPSLYWVVLCKRHGCLHQHVSKTWRVPSAALETGTTPAHWSTPSHGLHGNTSSGTGESSFDRAAKQRQVPV